jgi:hypothetical protein
MSNATDTSISIAGFSRAGTEHDGEVVIMDCERQTEVDDMGEEQVTYIPNTDSWLRFVPKARDGSEEPNNGSKTYTPANNYCNDVWSEADPPTTTITGKNRFFHSRISNSLRRQMSHTGGPTIDQMGLVSAKVGDVVATQGETVRKNGTVAPAFPVHATTYNFAPIPADDYHVCRPMGVAAQGVEKVRRGLESLSEQM